jgi:hypothetical protein
MKNLPFPRATILGAAGQGGSMQDLTREFRITFPV